MTNGFHTFACIFIFSAIQLQTLYFKFLIFYFYKNKKLKTKNNLWLSVNIFLLNFKINCFALYFSYMGLDGARFKQLSNLIILSIHVFFFSNIFFCLCLFLCLCNVESHSVFLRDKKPFYCSV